MGVACDSRCSPVGHMCCCSCTVTDARRDLAVRLQSSGGGAGSQGGLAAAVQLKAGLHTADSSLQGHSSNPAELLGTQCCPPAGAPPHAFALGSESGYQVLQISAAHALDDVPQPMQQQHSQQLELPQQPELQQEEEICDDQLQQDLNGQMLLQKQNRSKTAAGRLEAVEEGGDKAEALAGCIASSGGSRRPLAAVLVKPTLFDFSAADPMHASVHYMRGADQEDFRWVAFLGTCSIEELGASWIAMGQRQRSVVLNSLAHAWSAAGF